MRTEDQGAHLCAPPPAPLCRPSYVSCRRSLSSGQQPRQHTLIMPMPRALTLSPRAQPLFSPWGGHLQRTSSHLSFAAADFSHQLLCLSVNTTLFPPTSQLGFTPTRANMMSGIKSFMYLLRSNWLDPGELICRYYGTTTKRQKKSRTTVQYCT